MISKSKWVLVTTSVALLAACASRPESISASFVSHEKYAGRDCTQLGLDMSNARAELQKFSSMQDTKANIDAATVFFALVPASKLSGDHAGDVAKWKGEVEAVDTASTKAGCKNARPT
ncbi:MAG: hypothetical protein AAB176_09485 [Pseudomonadota bacterium]